MLLPNGTEVIQYVGGWITSFTYYEGVENGTDTLALGLNQTDSLQNGVSIEVVLNDDGTCKTTVHNNGTDMECASCTHCGFVDYDEFHYELDCTNVEINDNMVFTRTLTCDDSILPVLFPLDNDNDRGVVDEAPPAESNPVVAARNAATISRDSALLTMIMVTSLIHYSVWD
jgi:hypothetical protein